MNQSSIEQIKQIGICVHSFEGGALCFLEACRHGQALLGAHMHPIIHVSAIPMALSMPHWDTNNFQEVGKYLKLGVEKVAQAGADFFICPDNTAHLVLEKMMADLPIPGLHIADVVCEEITQNGWQKVALLGTHWTMSGEVYTRALRQRGLTKMIPSERSRNFIHNAIFKELCQGIFNIETTNIFIEAITTLKHLGADCVILGCTEIPLIITPENSPLPILDSTRLLSAYAVRKAISSSQLEKNWINPV